MSIYFSFKERKNFFQKGIATSLIMGLVALIIGVVGVVSTVFLTKVNQDVRQQASVVTYDQCFFGISSCPSGLIPSNDCNLSSCPSGSAICCKTPNEIQTDNCNLGNSFCHGTRLKVCVTDPITGNKNYEERDCAEGKICSDGRTACYDNPVLITPSPTPLPGNETCSQQGSRCCFDDREYNLSCGSGLIPNSTNPTTCLCIRPASECTPNTKRCFGNEAQQCTSAGIWVKTSICTTRCAEGSCVINLADGKICSKNEECQSGNCQSVPGSRICAPAGQAIGKVPAGGTCGTTSYDRTCVDGYVCLDNKCMKKLVANGASCSINDDCQSKNCQSVPGARICAPAGQSIGAVLVGETCGTNSYDRNCADGLVCRNNKCIALLALGGYCSNDNECQSGKCAARGGIASKTCVDTSDSLILNEGCGNELKKCCFDDKDYSLSCSNGLILSSDNPNSCYCYSSEQAVCYPGQTSCFSNLGLVSSIGKNKAFCSTKGIWVQQNCAVSCIGGSCCGDLNQNCCGQACKDDLQCTLGICQESDAIQQSAQKEIGEKCSSNLECFTKSCLRNSSDNYVCSDPFLYSNDLLFDDVDKALDYFIGNCADGVLNFRYQPTGSTYSKKCIGLCTANTIISESLSCELEEDIDINNLYYCDGSKLKKSNKYWIDETISECGRDILNNSLCQNGRCLSASSSVCTEPGALRKNNFQQLMQCSKVGDQFIWTASNTSLPMNSENCPADTEQEIFKMLNELDQSNTAFFKDHSAINISCGVFNSGSPAGYHVAGSNNIRLNCFEKNGSEISNPGCVAILIHELAHYSAGIFEITDGVINTESNSENSFSKAIGCRETGEQGIYNFAYENPVSAYGSTNCFEAFAEAARNFYLEPCSMKDNYPIQYEWMLNDPESPLGSYGGCNE